MADLGSSEDRPESDIYTLFLVIGTVFLITGTVYLAYKSQVLFETWLPF